MKRASASVLLVALATALSSRAFAPREAVLAWLALVLVSALALAFGIASLERTELSPGHFTLAVVGGALLLRLAALCAPVSLSDDAYRYVWDGALIVEGRDPFAARPDAIAPPAGLGEDALSRMNSPSYYSVYPPLAQASFAIAVGIGRTIEVDPTSVLRALFVLADLFTVALLIGLCARLGVSRGWPLLYAWHPLAYWEVAAGAHTEALMVPLLLLAIMALLDERPARAAVLLGLAASAKLTALLALPVLLVFAWRRHRSLRPALPLLLAPLVLLFTFAPFASATLVPHLTESLALYSETFSFNAPIYYGARFLLGYREGLTAPVDDLLMPILSALTLIAIAICALAQDGRAGRLTLGLLFSFAAHLLFSRVIHPWYLLPLLALAAIAQSRATALLGLLVPLSYLRYEPLQREAPLVIAAIFVPFAVALALEHRRRAPIPGR